MDISVVIVNYNVCDLLLNAVASVYVALEGIEGEIIVVDNASTDGAVEALNRTYPGVITIPLDRNLGFGAANNIGIERASGRYILILNPDTVVQEDTLRTMLAFMAEHPDATFAGCKIILPNGAYDPVSKRGFPSPWSSFCKVFGLSRLFPKSRLFGGYNLTYIDPDQTATVDALSGCFMFCRADELKALGGFDTDYFMYGEDLDLCYRATKRGGAIYYHPATSILHLRGQSTRRSSIDALAVFYEAMEIFARKHFRSNLALLWMLRLGIRVRRFIARALERFPAMGLAVVDVIATLVGFMIGSSIKFGGPFVYPDYAFPLVLILPSLIFIIALGVVGGYSSDDRAPGKALLGFMLGFFVLSTLPYFFRAYAFSRGVVLVTTGVAATIGVLARFLWLLYRRTFGAEAIRRVAFLGRRAIGPEARNAVRRMFATRPVAIVGTVVPAFSDTVALGEEALGTLENIGKIVREFGLTDILVFDSVLSYGEVLRAMEHVAKKPVHFHILHGSLESSDDAASGASMTAVVPARERRASVIALRKLRDRIAAGMALLFAPVVYLASETPGVHLRMLWEVLIGRRPLVGAAKGPVPTMVEPMFSMTALHREGTLSAREVAQIESFYSANQSFLLDCEIIIAVLRHRRPTVAIESVVKKGKRLPG
ncbi:MAG TPA: glycosyltransferase [Candidatus Kapabacteria bacterium]|nr:glycosyltransferase [Candidatus Kapabacteria bacterium]